MAFLRLSKEPLSEERNCPTHMLTTVVGIKCTTFGSPESNTFTWPYVAKVLFVPILLLFTYGLDMV